jgi:pimeloyl-ACP methyl ester carboxylesterase
MKKILKFLGYFLLTLIALVIVFLAVLFEKDIPVEKLKPKYTNTASRFMPLMGMQVHYRDEGNPNDSVPLILLHGMSSSLNTWDSVVLFIKENKRLISIDLPAFGLTGPNPSNEYSFAYYNRFLDSFFLQLNIKHCMIAGNSLGGAIAWEYTAANPQKVNKLVLIDAAGYPGKNAKGSIGFKIASTPVINNLLLYITPKSLVRKSLEGIYFDKNRVTDAQVERFHDVAISEGNRKAALVIFKKGFEREPEKINTITTPTLIIWGEKDGLIPVENASLFQKNIKGSKLEILPNVGHVPMEEAPKKVAELITAFIQ